MSKEINIDTEGGWTGSPRLQSASTMVSSTRYVFLEFDFELQYGKCENILIFRL